MKPNQSYKLTQSTFTGIISLNGKPLRNLTAKGISGQKVESLIRVTTDSIHEWREDAKQRFRESMVEAGYPTLADQLIAGIM